MFLVGVIGGGEEEAGEEIVKKVVEVFGEVFVKKANREAVEMLE